MEQSASYVGQKRTNKQRQAFFKKDPAQEQMFEETKRKYTAAICYILAEDITISSLHDFIQSPSAAPKIAILKNLRDQLLELRPHARQYLDKPYYLDLSIVKFDKQNGLVKVAIGGVVFKYDIRVVQTDVELGHYLRTLSQVIENSAVWDDPLLDVFKQAGTSSQPQVPDSLELSHTTSSIFQL